MCLTRPQSVLMCFSLANETGIAPTHSIKKLKSIFSEKAADTPSTASSPTEQSSGAPDPPSPKDRDTPKVKSC